MVPRRPPAAPPVIPGRDRWRLPWWWILPSILLLALYWPGLMAWFQQDDFVWLNLAHQAHGWEGILRALFQPNPVQGSWRPLPERSFFLVFTPLFGADALPYHVWIFLTQCANLALVSSITARMTRSRMAGLGAAILWVANSKLATAMSWASAYNQLLCAFFLLLALHFFVRFTQTGARRDYAWASMAFLSGFLAMETNVIFPLLAAAYAAGCGRRYLRHTLPWFAVSAAYTILHFVLSPNHAPEYRIHLDASLPATFWTYWRETFEPFDLRFLPHFWRIFGHVELAAATLALLAFTVCEALRRRWLAAVMLAWYVIALLPVLPLRDHIMEYYLTLPAMPMAMLAAYALCRAWNTRWRLAAVVLAAGFLATALPAARRHAEWYRVRSERQEDVVMGVARAHQLHPGKLILLDGVDDSLFSQLISQRPFLFLGIPDVYLAPGAEARIRPHPEWGGPASFELPAADTRRGLDQGQIEVYRVEPGSLRNVTRHFAVPPADSAAPVRVNLADPLAASFLGPEWYGPEAGYRWMPHAATLRMPAPRATGRKLYLTATAPAPVDATLSVDGSAIGIARFTRAKVETTFGFDLPPVSNREMTVKIEVGRTVRAGADQRDLGLAVSRLEIR